MLYGANAVRSTARAWNVLELQLECELFNSRPEPRLFLYTAHGNLGNIRADMSNLIEARR